LRLQAVIALALLSPACARPASPAATPRPPSTAIDPPVYTPPAQANGAPGAPVGLTVASGFGEARRAGLELLGAVVRGDAGAMSRLLAGEVARVLPRIGPVDRDREHVIAYALVEARRRELDAIASVDDLIGAAPIEVTPLSAFLGAREALPEGLRASDLVVSVPLSELGGRALRRVLPGWMQRGRLIVRLGPEPRIVGL
jgi:hypothetical protein